MSLIGDALSHAVLPGVAIGYLISGMSLVAMGVGGFIAGLAVAMLSGVVSRHTELKEDASFAGFYLGSLALGVTLVSLRGSSVDLLHVLFGSILAIDASALITIGTISSCSVLVLALIYRALVIESFDVTFLKILSRRSRALIHGLFLSLVVLNLVAGFQLLGTLMAVGMMMLPAACARFWSQRLPIMLLTAVGIGACASLVGLTWSYYADLPAGPAVILTTTLFFCFSVLFGSNGGMLRTRR
ncbi:metal ABC transporter permease [Dickeya oryzae]